MSKTLLLFLCTSISFHATAQNSVGFSLSLGLDQTREQLLGSAHYGGTGGSLAFFLQVNKPGHFYRMAFQLGLAQQRNADGWKATSGRYSLAYHFAFTASEQDNQTVYVGAGVSSKSIVNYFWQVDAQHLYWTSAISLSPLMEVKRTLPAGNQLYVQLQPLLLNLVSRPPAQRYYPDNPKPGRVWAQLHRHYSVQPIRNFFGIDIRTYLEFQKQSYGAGAVGCQTGYIHARLPRKHQSLYHHFFYQQTF